MENSMLEMSETDERNHILKMISNVGARTEDDIHQDELDLDNQLGGLTKLGVMNDLIAQLRVQNEEFIINIEGKTLTFNYKHDDPLFSLSNPVYDPTLPPSKKCNCCTEDFKSTKEAKHCEFCALSYCSKCRYKTR